MRKNQLNNKHEMTKKQTKAEKAMRTLALIALTVTAGALAVSIPTHIKRLEHENSPKTVASSNAQTTEFKVGKLSQSENLAPPVEGKKVADTEDAKNSDDLTAPTPLLTEEEKKTTDTEKASDTAQEEKGLVIVDEQAVLKGYAQVPVLFDSDGVWIDENGHEIAGSVAVKVFSEQPEYARSVILFNRRLTELNTLPRQILLRAYTDQYTSISVGDSLESMSVNTENDQYICKRLGNLVDEWKENWKYLDFVNPTAEKAYELYNEIMGLSPESVPLGQDGMGRWFDQDANQMTDMKVETWFEQHPECAELTRSIGQKTQESDMSLYMFRLMQEAFREGYVQNLCAQPTPTTSDDGYIWWKEELTDLQDVVLPECVRYEPPITY